MSSQTKIIRDLHRRSCLRRLRESTDKEDYKAGFILLRETPVPQVLIIEQKESGKWGVPKGGVEKTDCSAYGAATRELQEEVGINMVQLIKDGVADVFPTILMVDHEDPRIMEAYVYFIAVIAGNVVPQIGTEVASYKWVRVEAGPHIPLLNYTSRCALAVVANHFKLV